MIVDSSAMVAAILGEPRALEVVRHLAGADRVSIGAPTLAETGIVLVARLGPPSRSLLMRFCQEFAIGVVAFTDAHWPLALEAFGRYGKGRHPAALNLGDCLTYAVAAHAGEPLLCIGDDFPRTDLAVVA